MTPAGIEPATFRFVAQHLNHCAAAVPNTAILFLGNLNKIRILTTCLSLNGAFSSNLPVIPCYSIKVTKILNESQL